MEIAADWNGYKEWVSRNIQQGKAYFYRGQRDAAWKLQTTFHRETEKARIDLSFYFSRILRDACYHICARSNAIINLKQNEDTGMLLSLLQHHGFPTPLLDWTKSPYIAAFFAFKEVEEKQRCNARIYVFDYHLWKKKVKQVTNIRTTRIPHVSLFLPQARYNPRVIPQMGVYTITNQRNMEDYIMKKEKETGERFLYNFSIPPTERNYIMRELDAMGINDMAMFPDLDGLCRAMKEKHFTSRRRSTAMQTELYNEYLRQPRNAPAFPKVPKVTPDWL